MDTSQPCHSVLALILSLPYLPIDDLYRVLQTCSNFSKLCAQDFLWEPLYEQHFKFNKFSFKWKKELSWKAKFKLGLDSISLGASRWYKITPVNPKGALQHLPRQGHAACLIKNLPAPYYWAIVVYGGYLASGVIENDIFLLFQKESSEPIEYCWKRYHLHGWINIKTYGHTMTPVESGVLTEHCCQSDSIVIYGGATRAGYQGIL